MKIANPLSHDFLARKPAKAAIVLQSLEAEQAALYLASVPVRVLAPVIERIESWPAARIIELMPIEQSCAVLSQLNYPAAAALIRLLDDEQRQSMLAHLPKQLVRTIKQSLSYPEETVGAWMDSSTPHFSKELTAGDCLALLKKSGRSFKIVVAVDSKHRIEGVIPLSNLLISSPQQTLSELVDRTCVPLAAQVSLVLAKDAPDWQHYSALPIRTNNGVFVGAISRETLNRALMKTQPEHPTSIGDSLLAHMSRAMIATVAGLLALTSNSALTMQDEEKHNDVSR